MIRCACGQLAKMPGSWQELVFPPVVATRVGGLTAIIKDGETGLLVPWRDPALFAERLRVVLSDEALRARLAAHARASVLRFAWDHIAEDHLAMYEDVLAGREAGLLAAR